MISRFMAKLQEKPRRLLLVFGALVVLSLLSIPRIRVDTDMFSLLPQDLPGLSEFLGVSRTFGALDAVYGLFEGPDGPRARVYVDAFARQCTASGRIAHVVARFPREAVAARGVPPQTVLFLAPEDLTELRKRLDPSGYPEALARVRRTLLSPLGARAAPWIQKDPLGLQLVLLRGLQRLPRPAGLDPEGYWGREQDGRYRIFVYVQPAAPPGDIEFSEALMTDLRAADAAAREEVGGSPGELRALFTGAHAVSVEEARALRSDMVGTPGLSLALVLAVCWVYFRGIRPIAALGACLGISMVLGVGFVSLFLGRINVATAGFAAVLCGIADDYGVHLYNGLRHQGPHGLREVFRVEGRSVTLGALTTAAAFLVLVTSAFPGLRQFGILMAASTLASLLAMGTVFLTLAGRPRKPHTALTRPFRVWEGWLWRRRGWVLVGAATLLLLAGLGWPRTRFEPNLRKLSATGETQAAEEQILRLFGNRLEPLVFWWEGEKLAEGLRAMDELERSASGNPAVDHAETPLLFHPKPRGAEAAREVLGDLDPARVRTALESAIRKAGLRPAAFDAGIAFDAELVRIARLDSDAALDESLLPPELQASWGSRFVKIDGNKVHLAAYVFPSQRITRPDEARRLAESLGVRGPRWKIAGFGLLSGPLQDLLLRDLRRTTTIAALLVVAVALIGLRSPVRALLALLPVAAATVATGGLMGLLGIPFNVINFAAVPLILGLGIDYGLHLVTVAWARPEKPVSEILSDTGFAITSNTATTLLGFGALLAARHGGLVSFGGLACLGVALSWLATIALLPPLLRLCRGGRP